MIAEKSGLLFLWILCVFVACILPFLRVARLEPPRWARISLIRFVGILWLLAVVLDLSKMAVPTFASPIVLAVTFLLPLILAKKWWQALGGLAALPLMAATTWWAPSMKLGWGAGLAFLGIGVLASAMPLLFTWVRNRFLIDQTRLGDRRSEVAILAALFVVAVVSVLWLGPMETWFGFAVTWHHWGAYASSVQTLLGGGIPFADFPVQYGMGPTLLIALLGQQDPYLGTYLATAMANTVYMCALGACVLLLLRQNSRSLVVLAVLALLSSVLLWIGYPPSEFGSMTYPSVGGLRFLPLALLMAFIFYAEIFEKPYCLTGSVIWFFILAWSPEAAVYATIVWFPYLGLRSAQALPVSTVRNASFVALRGALIAIAAVIGGGLFWALVFYIGFGELPSLSGYLTYIINPPGILSANLQGPVWLIVATLVICVVTIARSDGEKLRLCSVCLLALLAVSSYYIGRSHDNNLLNLFPFVVLALAASLSVKQHEIVEGFLRLILIGIIAWPATFGWQIMNEAFAKSNLTALGPQRFLQRLQFVTPDAWKLIDDWAVHSNITQPPSQDLGSALLWLHETTTSPVFVLNQNLILPRQDMMPAWTGVNNLANFATLPPDVIRKFVHAGALRFHRAGWIVRDASLTNDWLKWFATDYTIEQKNQFGDYVVYHMVPKCLVWFSLLHLHWRLQQSHLNWGGLPDILYQTL